MKAGDLKVALGGLADESDSLLAAVEAADGRATPALLAEALLLAVRTAKRMARLREQLQGGGKKGGK